MPSQPENRFPPGGRLFWRTMCRPARYLMRVWFPLRTRGRDQIPEGPVVFAANHFSHLDPVLVGATVSRPVRYLAVDELYGSSSFFDWLTTWLGAIPMSRTRAPLGALRTALEELDRGGSVGLFPEGVRVWTWGEVDPKRGAAWLARRAGVPLVPVAIAGSDDAMGRGQMRIDRRPMATMVCEPIFPEDFATHDDPLGAMADAWEARIGAAIAEFRAM